MSSIHRTTLIVWGRWLGAFTLITVLFVNTIHLPEVRISHGILAYLLLIVGVCREDRRWLTVVMVLAGYMAVDWLFIPPLRSFGAPTPMDFIILLGFILTSVIISQLVSNLQRAVHLATERANEIEQMSEQQLLLEREAARARVSYETEQMKSALIASIAHDLRSPITTLKLLSDPGYGTDPRHALSRVSDEADRINNYLTTMRHFNMVESSSGLMKIESHVVDDLVDTAIASYEGTLSGRQITVHPLPNQELLRIRCDMTLSILVLGNLLQNAVRYSAAPLPIDIFIHDHAEHLRIVVADRGPGIPDAEVDIVFQPRKRGSGSMSTDGQGMGLAIARTFARAQLGDVFYRPRHGGGAEFNFMLPLGGNEPRAVPNPASLST